MLAGAACIALFATAAAAAANVIVVRSIGPVARLYPVGRTLPDTVRIGLRRGESVTLLGRGGTRIFRGPGSFSPIDPVRPGRRDGPQRAQSGRLGGIMMSSIDRPRRPISALGRIASAGASAGASADAPEGARRARIGAIRVRLPTIWDIDAAWSGTICLWSGRDVSLWRADAAAALRLSILAADGASGSVEWPAGDQFAAWPADLPIADGAAFALRRDATGVPQRIAFRLVAQPSAGLDSSDPVALADAFIAQGCQAQLDRLIEATMLEADSSAAR